MRRALDPRICNVTIDANALDRDGSTRDKLVNRLLELSAAGTITLMVPKGVRIEMQHPHTPAHVRDAGLSQIFTIQTGLTAQEQALRRLIEQELQGDAKPGSHAADADHLFEANKYGGYFITHDKRILDRTSKLRARLSPALNVVTLQEFFTVLDDFEAGRRL
jgi:hypothetical protein